MTTTNLPSRPLQIPEEPPSLALVPHPALPEERLHDGLVRRLRADPSLLTELQLFSAELAARALRSDPHAFFLGHGTGVGKTRILAAVAADFLLRAAEDGGAAKVLWLVPNQLTGKQVAEEAALLGLEAAMKAPEAGRGRLQIVSYHRVSRDATDAHQETAAVAQQPRLRRLLILDEAHVLRNCTHNSAAVALLQQRYECVVYSTATPASEIAQLGYMDRLGIWGSGAAATFPDFASFCKAMKSWGPAASEVLAMDLKRRGLYIAHRFPPAALTPLEVTPPLELQRLFDDLCVRWQRAPSASKIDSRSFMKRLTTSIKCRSLVGRWRQDVGEGYSVVLILQGTGAAARVSLLKELCVRNGVAPPDGLPLDALQEIQQGLAPLRVVEVTGRPVQQRRASSSGPRSGNAREIGLFTTGQSRVLCLSAAGSVGLNLVSPFPSRVYVLETSWTPEVLMQQLGRCYRLTTEVVPESFNVTMNTFVEKRVEAALLGRACSLSALSCADRSFESFSFLHLSSRLLRLVCVEMAARLLAERLPETELEEVLEKVSRTIPFVTEVVLPSELTHWVLSERILGADSNKKVLTKLLSSNSFLVREVSPRWCPRKAQWFSAAEKLRLLSCSLCVARKGLPPSLQDLVFQYATPSSWSIGLLCERSHLGVFFLDLRGAQLLNEAALLPLEDQRRLYRACEDMGARLAPRTFRLQDVTEFCCGKRQPTSGFACSHEVLWASPEDVEVYVTFRNTTEAVKEPRLFQTGSGNVVHVSQEGAWIYPGRPPMVRRKGEAPPQLRPSVPPTARLHYRELEAEHLRHREALARTLSRRLVLKLKDPLKHWGQSLGKVLYVPPSEGQPEPLVGLLMGAYKNGRAAMA